MSETTRIERHLAVLQAWMLVGAIFTILAVVSIIVVMVVVLGEAQQSISRSNEIALNTNVAMCAFKHSIEFRSKQLDEFIDTNPKGIPGIPPAFIQQQADSYHATLRALTNLECKEFP